MTLFVGCWGSGEAKDKASHDEAFKEIFGFDAPPSVADLKSNWYFMRDSYVRWLRFSSDDATLSKLRDLKGIKAVQIAQTYDAPGDPDKSHNPNAPTWWRDARMSPVVEEFEFDRSKPTETDIVHIWIDKSSRTVYAARDVLN